MKIQTPALIMIKFCTHPHLSNKGFGAGLTPATSPLGLGGLKYLKLKDTFLKTVYKTKDVWLVDN